MIERYSRPQMRAIWTEENKFDAYLKVEILSCEAWSKLGVIPAEDVEKIRRDARFDVDRIHEIEEQTRHDVVAFTRCVSESLGEEKKWVHYGLTSTDVVDTANGYLIRQADDILRKDMEAWYQDDWKTNFTYKPSELDINVPNNAYAKWNNGVGYVQFGRFSPDDLKVSKNDILIGGAPYHDGILWKFEPGIFRYDFMLSSLNPWLFGDVTDHSTGCPPVGTEAYDQKCTDPGRQVSNQWNRTYTDNVKNLVFHRFGVETDKFWAYVVEQSMVGGKALEFRSISPFIYWHDNYATGYTSAMTSFELGYKTANGVKFYGQINMEDINSPVGEDDDKGTNRSILNYMAG